MGGETNELVGPCAPFEIYWLRVRPIKNFLHQLSSPPLISIMLTSITAAASSSSSRAFCRTAMRINACAAFSFASAPPWIVLAAFCAVLTNDHCTKPCRLLENIIYFLLGNFGCIVWACSCSAFPTSDVVLVGNLFFTLDLTPAVCVSADFLSNGPFVPGSRRLA